MRNQKRYLVDTHILLWWLLDDRKLTKKIRNVIIDVDNHILVSAASVWEIAIKKSNHRIDVPSNYIAIVAENNIEIVPITSEHALYVEYLPHIHSDPFDRMLIAQSIVERATLITADKNIHRYKADGLKLY